MITDNISDDKLKYLREKARRPVRGNDIFL